MKKQLPSFLMRLFFILLFITVFSISYLLLSDKKQISTISSPALISTDTQKPIEQPVGITILQNVTKNNITPSTTTQTIMKSEKTEDGLIVATLKTPDRSYFLDIKPKTTLLDAMRQLTVISSQPFIFSGREYPSLGFFVEEINGLKNNAQQGSYWIYYINEQPAKTGISNYEIKENDLIEWKYEKSKF